MVAPPAGMRASIFKRQVYRTTAKAVFSGPVDGIMVRPPFRFFRVFFWFTSRGPPAK